MTKPVSRKMAVDCLIHRLRINGDINCAICGGPLYALDAIQFDHIHADVHGGAHDYMNLRPLHAECHKTKTKSDVQAKAKGDRILGLTCNGPKRKIPSRPFPKRATP